MKRKRDEEDESYYYDEEDALNQAILESKHEANEWCMEKFALKESLRFAQIQDRLKLFQKERQKEIKSVRVERQHSENINYNQTITTLLTVDLILIHILRHASLTLMMKLTTISMHLRGIVIELIEKHQSMSVLIEHKKSLTRLETLALNENPLARLLYSRIDSIRVKVRVDFKNKIDTPQPILFQLPQLKSIILNVIDESDVEWFIKNVNPYKLRIQIHYAHRVTEESNRLPFIEAVVAKVNVSQKNLQININVDTLYDPYGEKFDAMTNFNTPSS